MRTALSILLIGIILAVPVVVLGDAVFERESRAQTAAGRVGTGFVWPAAPVAADPEAGVRVLAEAAEATGANVLRTSVGTSESGRTRVTHYVYLERERTRLFDAFTLAEGRWLTRAESRSGTATVTSAGSAETEIVGAPTVFADGYELTFAPLRHAFDSLPVAGRYTIEAPDQAAAERFRAIVHQRLVEMGMTELTVADLAADDIRAAPRGEISLRPLPYALVAIAALLVAAILLREGKRIGVMRLVGHSTMRIWYRAVGRTQLVSVLAGALLCGALPLAVPGADASFAWTLAAALLRVTAVVFGVTLAVGLVVINRVHVADLIKGGL